MQTFEPVLKESQSDASVRARSLARMIDRLEPGTYELQIIKPSEKHLAWSFELTQPVVIRKGNLPKECIPE